jgi:hypothetical protein
MSDGFGECERPLVRQRAAFNMHMEQWHLAAAEPKLGHEGIAHVLRVLPRLAILEKKDGVDGGWQMARPCVVVEDKLVIAPLAAEAATVAADAFGVLLKHSFEPGSTARLAATPWAHAAIVDMELVAPFVACAPATTRQARPPREALAPRAGDADRAALRTKRPAAGRVGCVRDAANGGGRSREASRRRPQFEGRASPLLTSTAQAQRKTLRRVVGLSTKPACMPGASPASGV